MALPEPAVALLAALMLRGPQTPGELRINTERLFHFTDPGAVEAALQALSVRAEPDGGPLTVQLPRAPGSREQRWAHLVCGPVVIPAAPLAGSTEAKSAGAAGAEIATLKAQVARLTEETAELRTLLERLYRNLGVEK
jgi:uncharacterized protein